METKYKDNKTKTSDQKQNQFAMTKTGMFIFLVTTMTSFSLIGSAEVFAQNETNDSSGLFKTPENIVAGKIIPGQYIVTLINQTGPTIASLSDAAETRDLQVVDELENLNVLIVNGSELGVSALSDDTDGGAIVEPNRILVAKQLLATGIDRIDAEKVSTSNATTMKTAASLNQTTDNSVEATIGILDTGIDLNNPQLNVVNDVSFISQEPTGQDLEGHGTHVAGIAAAKDIGNGVVGVAPGAKLIAIKVLGSDGSGSTASVLAGLDYALSHADELDVINLSLGGPGSSVATDIAISKLVAAGVPVVVASGNEADNAMFYSPANSPEAWTVSSISDSDGKCGGLGEALPWTTLGVNVNQPDDSYSWFSNYGELVDIAAPGDFILSTIPGGQLQENSGTSMASPHVAGAVALYKSGHPTATPTEIFEEIISSANTNNINCDTSQNDGRGYIESWEFDLDDQREPLLYVKDLKDRQ